jgi:hypothetical protein
MLKTFAILTLTASPLLAQTYLSVGAGPALTWLNSSVRDEVQGWPRLGFNASLQLEQAIGPELSIVLGPSIESKGERYELLAPDYGEDWGKGEIALTYVQVPLLLKFSSEGTGTRVYGLLGPEAGFLLSKRVEWDGRRVHDEDFEKWSSVDLGVGYGIGVDFAKHALDPRAFFIRLGGFYGLVDGVAGFSNPFWKYRSDSRNVNLKLTLGVRFGNGKPHGAARATADAPVPPQVPPPASAPAETPREWNGPQEILDR